MSDEFDSGGRGLRFFFFDVDGNACRISQREWMALHEDLEYRRRRPEDRTGPPPPHKSNPLLVGRMVIVVQAFISTEKRRVRKAEDIRAFRHQFDQDGRLNLEFEERHLRASIELRNGLLESSAGKSKENSLAEFQHKLSTEEAALVRAHLYRSKHSRK